MIIKTNTIIGHRGCRLWMGQKRGSEKDSDVTVGEIGDFPAENTVDAFLMGAELGADYVEMDIRKTRDGVLVVHHDAELDGMRIKGSAWKDLLEHAVQREMPLEKLEDVLRKLEGKAKLDVELKEAGYEEEVVGLILQYFEPANFLVKSFLDRAVKRIKERFPTVTCGLLLGIGKRDDLMNLDGLALAWQRVTEFFPWVRVRACQADFIAPNWQLCALGLHLSAKKRGIPVLVWTLNDAELIKKFMLSFAVNGIITDQPGLAVEIRNNL